MKIAKLPPLVLDKISSLLFIIHHFALCALRFAFYMRTKISWEPFPGNIYEIPSFLTQTLESANIFRYIYKAFIVESIKNLLGMALSILYAIEHFLKKTLELFSVKKYGLF